MKKPSHVTPEDDINITDDEKSDGEKDLPPANIAVVNPEWQSKLAEIAN